MNKNVSLQLMKYIGYLKICRPISLYRGLSSGMLQLFLHIFIDGLNIRFPALDRLFVRKSVQMFLAVEVFFGGGDLQAHNFF